MGGVGTIVADVLFPRDCAACDAPLLVGHERALCDACWASLRMPTHALCPRCGIPTPPVARTCSGCATHPPVFDAAYALGLYMADDTRLNPLAAAVRALKYRGARPLARCLGTELGRRHPGPAGAVVVPVPLHRSRLRERGYNQAALLARALARTSGLSVAVRALARVRPTPPQAGLDAHTRRTNLRGAFAVRQPAAVLDREVMLVDDVLTTGATADACAAALRAARATRVILYTVGRTP